MNADNNSSQIVLAAAAAEDEVESAAADNGSLSLYIERRLGARHLPLTTIVPISAVYACIFLVGVLGNISTCLVIYKNKYMQTPTNVYLANLAVSDLLTHLVVMPFEIYLLWRQYPWVFGEMVCDAKMLTTETVTFASIFTIVAFTIERYLAICHPLNIPRKSKMTRAVRTVFVIWIVSVVFSLPWIFYNKVNYLTHETSGEVIPESAWCAIPWNEEEESKTPLYFMILSTFAAFIFPFTLVIVLYFKIGLAMKNSSALQRCAVKHVGRECETEITYNRGRKAVIRMLVAVVLVFFVCWTPFHAQRLMFVIVTLKGTWTASNAESHHILFLASGVGYYLSSSVNPLLYSVMSKRFRRGFRDMFRSSGSPPTVGPGGNGIGGAGNGTSDSAVLPCKPQRRRQLTTFPLRALPAAGGGGGYPQQDGVADEQLQQKNHLPNIKINVLHEEPSNPYGPILSSTPDAQLIARWSKRSFNDNHDNNIDPLRKNQKMSVSLQGFSSENESVKSLVGSSRSLTILPSKRKRRKNREPRHNNNNNDGGEEQEDNEETVEKAADASFSSVSAEVAQLVAENSYVVKTSASSASFGERKRNKRKKSFNSLGVSVN